MVSRSRKVSSQENLMLQLLYPQQQRTPGNCGKGLIPKIWFLSGCLLAKFVRVVPGLPYIFLLLSGSSDQGVFSPRIVRIAYLRLSGPPKSAWPSKRASEWLYFSELWCNYMSNVINNHSSPPLPCFFEFFKANVSSFWPFFKAL